MRAAWMLMVLMLAAGCAGHARSGAARGARAGVPRGLAGVPARMQLAFVSEGTLEAHGERTPKTKLALAELSITATTSGDVAETTVEHVFRSDADERLEVRFASRFPLERLSPASRWRLRAG